MNATRRLVLKALPAALLMGSAHAQPMRLRFGTIAPRGSTFHRVLMEVGEAWRRAEGESHPPVGDGPHRGDGDGFRMRQVPSGGDEDEGAKHPTEHSGGE